MLVGALAALSGCGDDECPSAVGEDGAITLAAGPFCLEDVTVRARSQGSWRDDAAEVELALVEGGVQLRMSAPAPVEAFELRVAHVSGDRMLQQGMQSWSFSGATYVPAQVPLHADGAPLFLAPDTGEVFDEVLGVSYGSTVVGDDDGPYLTAGATSAAHAHTGFAVAGEDGDNELVIVYGTGREPLPASAGVVTSETIAFYGSAQANAGLALLGDAIVAALPEDARPARAPPGGWFSWNQRFEAIDQAYIRAHIALLATELLPHGLDLVELDDGWQVGWGDWRANDKFADGLDVLAGEINAAGMTAGIWMAPFLVDVESELAATLTAEYFVRDEDGDPLVHAFTGSVRDFYIIDGSNPAAVAEISAAISALADAGFTFFKFDFLYAGALPGQHHGAVTGVEAMRAGMAGFRAAAGEGAIINACGTPILPILGLADSLRIGADTAFTTPDLDWSMIAFAARSYAARAHLAPAIWPDSDQVQLRSPYSEVQAEVGAIVAALAGPAYSLGDDLTLLDPSRLDIALGADILDMARASTPALPMNLMAVPSMEVVYSPGLEAVRYPDHTEAPPPSRFRATGASGTSYDIEFSWLAPHGVTVTVE